MFLVFTLLTVLEVRTSPLNAFVLLTVAATYLKGGIVRRVSYEIVASLIASIFAFLELLVVGVSGEFSYALF